MVLLRFTVGVHMLMWACVPVLAVYGMVPSVTSYVVMLYVMVSMMSMVMVSVYRFVASDYRLEIRHRSVKTRKGRFVREYMRVNAARTRNIVMTTVSLTPWSGWIALFRLPIWPDRSPGLMLVKTYPLP